MDIIEAIILGLIQGLAEFLPISSSGHLAIAMAAMGIEEEPLLLAVLFHMGTLVAVLVVFWRDWWEMLKNPFKSKALWLLALATLPAALLGVLLSSKIDQLFGAPWFVGIFFLLTTALLLVAERFARSPVPTGRRARKPGVEDVRLTQALAMGAMQGAALFPGLSRSGSTIVGGMLSGLDRATATKFSFMMSAPIILGSTIFEARDLFKAEGGIATALSGGWLAPLIGVVVAGISGYFAIRWMLRLVQRVSLGWFALYTGVLGALVLLDHFVFDFLV